MIFFSSGNKCWLLKQVMQHSNELKTSCLQNIIAGSAKYLKQYCFSFSKSSCLSNFYYNSVENITKERLANDQIIINKTYD